MKMFPRSVGVLLLALAVIEAPTGAKDERKPPKHRDDLTIGRGSVAGEAIATRTAVSMTALGAGVSATSTSTLVLYDTTGPYGWLGELYGMMAGNLVSHFGSWTAHPIVAYAAGEINRYTAVVYLGSTYDEPIPVAFLADVSTSTKPVIWAYDNIWQLTNYVPNFATTYGWNWTGFDYSPVVGVLYKGTVLKRYAANGAGIMNYSTVGFTAQVPAYAVPNNSGPGFPWAVRSRNLTYIGENPLAYIGEGDRYLAFVDLLFDALAPQTVERHRALVRIEDVNATTDPLQLRSIADYLSSRHAPFSVGVVPLWKDPLGVYNGGVADTIRLKDAPEVVNALKYMQQRGGTLVEHGYTHQYDRLPNPYTGTTADDFEFYRVTENPDHTLVYQGPVAQDSTSWAAARVKSAAGEFTGAKLSTPTIFEFPHYAGSAIDYRVMAENFAARYERALYFRGLLTGASPDYTHFAGQQFPFLVRDVYGSLVLPEDLGAIEPTPWFIFPARLPRDIYDDASRSRIVRDGFASFFFHPFYDLSYLKQTVEGLEALGYTFVSPAQALSGATVTLSGVRAAHDDTVKDDDTYNKSNKDDKEKNKDKGEADKDEKKGKTAE